MAATESSERAEYKETMGHRGLRLTPQRCGVYEVLLEGQDHPTASEIFLRAKKRMPAISLATVYNCLETLVERGLARQVHFEREAARYCANREEHGHFVCDRCGKVFDVPLKAPERAVKRWDLPAGFAVTRSEITLHGLCDACNT